MASLRAERETRDGSAAAFGAMLYNRFVHLTVLLFASIAEAVGQRRLSVAIDVGETVGSVRDRLVRDYPVMERFVPTLLYALDEEYARLTDAVHAGATLALIPPVSGGC